MLNPYTGQKVTYFNWNTGEPNNSGNEDYAAMLTYGSGAGKWNDIPSSSSSSNVICQMSCPDGKLFMFSLFYLNVFCFIVNLYYLSQIIRLFYFERSENTRPLKLWIFSKANNLTLITDTSSVENCSFDIIRYRVVGISSKIFPD